MPANTFLLHYGVYLWLVALGTAIIWGLSFLMQHWLERVITRPVEALQKRIETVGSGNFAPDRTVEWNNELGDIGRGINQLAENVDSLMTRRVEDERRKQELEYRMLQNEVNPHFIYNTLNSIRWMATIQHAPGIAEMVTAFARLTKSISKGTQKLVPLQEELALLNDYFTIQQYRYGGDLEIEVSRIESETLCRDCMIPRFTLQPLAENAIFHGLEPKGGHGSVLLDISTDPDEIVLAIDYLRDFFDCNDKYKSAGDFVRNVIEVNLGFINQYTNLKVSFRKHKKGRSISHVIFKYENTWNNDPKAEEHNNQMLDTIRSIKNAEPAQFETDKEVITF